MRKKSRVIALAAALCLLLCGCGGIAVPAREGEASQPSLTKHSETFYDAFNTVTTVIGYAPDQAAFDRAFSEAMALFSHYHCVFDGYNAYDGVQNLYVVNRDAPYAPVQAEPELIELLLYMKELQPKLRSRVNVAMGAVLALWHDCREAGTSVPAKDALLVRGEHCDLDDVIVDAENGTVFFADPLLRLDLGAIGKGWATERVAQWLLQSEMPSFIISAGGNVRCGEPPRDGRAFWGVGVQDPDDQFGSTLKDVIFITGMSVVSSGDYQRYYTVDGVRYHHIIDPDTLFPSTFMRQVTVVTEDSGYADALSTALFLMPYEEGRALVDALDGVEAYWVLNDGAVRYTDGMKPLLQSLGATSAGR